MKLTNYLRDAFIKAAMDDVPHIDYDEQIRVAAQQAAFERLPKEVQKLWKDPKTQQYIKCGSISIGNYPAVSVMVPGFSHYSDMLYEESPAARQKFFAQFNELVAKRNAQIEQRKNLEAKLRGAAYSVTTRKALMAMLPEFDKYLPDDEVKANRQLPVVANLVSDFVKAGWPKSEHDRRAKVNTKLKAKGADLVPA